MTDKLKPPASPGMAEASAKFEHEAEAPVSEDQNDIRRVLAESAAAGDKTARIILDEDSSWREMIFVSIQDNKTVVQWPPVEVTGRDDVLRHTFECTIGTQCAMDLIGHVRSHSKDCDGSRLMDMAEKIVSRGKWGYYEIGFFTGLGDFITWGHIRTGTDFEAFPSDAKALVGRDDTALSATHSAVDLRDQWDRLRLDLEDLNRKHDQLSDSEYGKRFDDIVQALGGIETAIQHAPANDWQTVLVKLHVAVGLAQDQVGKLDKHDHPFVELLRTVTRDVGRLAGEAQS